MQNISGGGGAEPSQTNINKMFIIIIIIINSIFNKRGSAPLSILRNHHCLE